jgi:hypothetical protein
MAVIFLLIFHFFLKDWRKGIDKLKYFSYNLYQQLNYFSYSLRIILWLIPHKLR